MNSDRFFLGTGKIFLPNLTVDANGVQGLEVTHFEPEEDDDVQQRNVRISSQGVAVDQDYFWNYNLIDCPTGKVQLLSIDGLPTYGKLREFKAGFIVAWAPLPKARQ